MEDPESQLMGMLAIKLGKKMINVVWQKARGAAKPPRSSCCGSIKPGIQWGKDQLLELRRWLLLSFNHSVAKVLLVWLLFSVSHYVLFTKKKKSNAGYSNVEKKWGVYMTRLIVWMTHQCFSKGRF